MTDPVSEGLAAAHPRRRPRRVRRLYDWVLHWADTPYGLQALALLALVESSVFPVPPDPLLIALCLGAAGRSLRFAAVATVASVLGGMLGYGIGAVVWSSASGFFFECSTMGLSPQLFGSHFGRAAGDSPFASQGRWMVRATAPFSGTTGMEFVLSRVGGSPQLMGSQVFTPSQVPSCWQWASKFEVATTGSL